MADPATDTIYPASLDEMPEVGPLDRQNVPGLEHDEMHNRANAILNALQALIGLEGDGPEVATVLGRLARAEEGDKAVEENVQSGTSYTLVAADAFKMICMTNGAANTLTVPPNSAVAFAVGTRVDLSQDGAGKTTVAAGAGVTIRSPETLAIRKRYGKATLIKRAADTWDLEGNLEAAP